MSPIHYYYLVTTICIVKPVKQQIEASNEAINEITRSEVNVISLNQSKISKLF